MWPFNLSVRLLIVDLVSRYLTNYLIRREPIFHRIATLVYSPCGIYTLCGISTSFPVLSRFERQVAHALLTRPPLTSGSKLPEVRSTWMCYARRQRSSWARIKLSNICISSRFPRFIPYSSFPFALLLVSGSFLRNFRDLKIWFFTSLCTFVSLFNFQCPSPSLADSFTILSHYLPFVNTFF